jgi:hypothetical protein
MNVLFDASRDLLLITIASEVQFSIGPVMHDAIGAVTTSKKYYDVVRTANEL